MKEDETDAVEDSKVDERGEGVSGGVEFRIAKGNKKRREFVRTMLTGIRFEEHWR